MNLLSDGDGDGISSARAGVRRWPSRRVRSWLYLTYLAGIQREIAVLMRLRVQARQASAGHLSAPAAMPSTAPRTLEQRLALW
jgi:hypothetical protein